MTLLVHQVRFDLLAYSRNPRARFFTVAFPVIMLLIFNGVFGAGNTIVDGVHVRLKVFYVAGILALSIVNAAYASLVVTVVTARASGVLKRRRATPAPAWVLVIGQSLASVVVALGTSAALLAISKVGWDVSFAAGSLLALFCAVVVGTLALSSLAYAVAGLVGSPDAAQPIVQATMLPLYFISGVWIPSSALPGGLRTVAALFPIEHLAEAMHRASVHASFIAAFSPWDLLALAAWGALSAMFAARRFSWLPAS